MPKDYPRSYRVADQIQRDVPGLIRSELKDPRISALLTVSSVDVSKDLSIAKIYYTVLNESEREATEAGLQQSAGYIRKLLGQRLRMRSVPEIRFIYDTTMEDGLRMSSLIDAAVKSNTTADSND